MKINAYEMLFESMSDDELNYVVSRAASEQLRRKGLQSNFDARLARDREQAFRELRRIGRVSAFLAVAFSKQLEWKSAEIQGEAARLGIGFNSLNSVRIEMGVMLRTDASASPPQCYWYVWADWPYLEPQGQGGEA